MQCLRLYVFTAHALSIFMPPLAYPSAILMVSVLHFRVSFWVLILICESCLASITIIIMSAFENAHKFVHDVPASEKAGVSGLSEAVAKAAELGMPTDEVSLRKVIAASGVSAASAQGGTRVSVDW